MSFRRLANPATEGARRTVAGLRRRGHRFVRWLALGVLATVAACAPAPRAHEPEPSAWRHVPIGLCEDYPEESRSLEGARQDFELLRRLGVNTLRVSFGWDAIEPERDRYELEFWDAFVDMAVR